MQLVIFEFLVRSDENFQMNTVCHELKSSNSKGFANGLQGHRAFQKNSFVVEIEHFRWNRCYPELVSS